MPLENQPKACTESPAPAGADTIRWVVHPAVQESIWKSGALILIVLAFGILVSLSFDSNGYGVLTVLLLATSQSRYFFPTRYAVDSSGVTISHLASRRIVEWGNFRRYVATIDGVFLSPFTTPHRLDSFRGVYIRCVGNREEVVASVQRHFSNRSN